MKENKYIDYTPTDTQLENICKGMLELEDKDNCFIVLRMNEIAKDQMKIAAMVGGKYSYLLRAVVKTMEDREEFAEMIFKAVEIYKNIRVTDKLESFIKDLEKLLGDDSEEEKK